MNNTDTKEETNCVTELFKKLDLVMAEGNTMEEVNSGYSYGYGDGSGSGSGYGDGSGG